MPDLPTITINNQAIYDRITAAYGDIATYKAWLKVTIRDYVMRTELEVLKAQQLVEQQDLRDDIGGQLSL